MSTLNKVMLIGNLGDTPKILKASIDGSFVHFSIATTRQYKNADGTDSETTQWHKVTASGHNSKYALSYFKKGDKVFIEGELRYQRWRDKKTGEEKFSTVIYTYQCCSLMPGRVESIDEAKAEVIHEWEY